MSRYLSVCALFVIVEVCRHTAVVDDGMHLGMGMICMSFAGDSWHGKNVAETQHFLPLEILLHSQFFFFGSYATGLLRTRWMSVIILHFSVM